ncbi:MAG: peptidoglycan-binding protein [Desulfosporosinus sp.]|nr:peptidoglycan-binding protein [Desulfosporosinus sp.]
MPSLSTLRLGSQGPYVKKLKLSLNGLSKNYNNFSIDYSFDQKTEDAVKNYQDDIKLFRDGIVGPATWASLIARVKMIQVKLNSLGDNSGTPDGWFGLKTTNAVKKFQSEHGLVQEGIVNPRTRAKLFNPHPRDNFESRSSSIALSSLDPYVGFLAGRFLRLCSANHLDVRITTAFRSWDESDRLYALGRTVPGSIVSNARGGDSYHNWGLAFDAGPFENNKISTDPTKFNLMGRLGEQVGLEWGGTFKSIIDLPHFQYTFGLTTEDLLNGKRPPR